MKLKKIIILYIDAGEGHRAAARALADAIERQKRPWQVELVNLDEVLEPADPAYWILRVRTNQIYNWLTRRGWILATRQLLPVVHAAFRVLQPAQVFVLRRYWRKQKPDLVVSVVPHRNRWLWASLQRDTPQTPFVTILTDLADYPPHFWIERQEQHFICGTPAALQQAKTVAPAAKGIWPVSGMILHPRFHERVQIDRAEERRKLGLDPDLPTGLVLFGGLGSKSMLDIARCFCKSNLRLQLIFLCGRNARLMEKLRALRLPFPAQVEGFTQNVTHFMALSDFLIGKPGPGSISEALAMRLPVIVKHGITTMVHERFNVGWIEEQGVGLGVKRVLDLPEAVGKLLEPATYQAMRQRIDALNNRAVFEIPDVLDKILKDSFPAEYDEGPLLQQRSADQPSGGHV